MYNVKSLIKHQEPNEEGIDLKLRTATLKNTPNAKKVLAPYYTPTSPDDHTLVFESRFESGNLCLAIKVQTHHLIGLGIRL